MQEGLLTDPRYVKEETVWIVKNAGATSMKQ